MMMTSSSSCSAWIASLTGVAAGCIPSCQLCGPAAQPACGRPASRIAANPTASPIVRQSRSADPGARRPKHLVNSIMSLQPLIDEDAPVW